MRLECIGVYDEGTDLWMLIPTLLLNDRPPPEITLPSGFKVKFVKTTKQKKHLYKIISGPNGYYLGLDTSE